MNLKRIISIFMSITILSTMFAFPTINSNAQTENNFAAFSGTYDYESPIEFKIYNVNNNNTFLGNIKLNDTLATINKQVTGEIYFYDDYYTCKFTCSYRWLFTTYEAAFLFKIDPYDGTLTGEGGGGMLLFSDNISMKGTINKFYDKSLSYSEYDMKMCMALSKTAYSGDYDKNLETNFINTLTKYVIGTEKKEIDVHNYDADSDPDNAAFAIMNRKNLDGSIDEIVVIRGTYREEWSGNVELTGKSYDPDIKTHDNYTKAKDSIRPLIYAYYNKFCKNYDKVNLIITGHSRGAAVANLYAKAEIDSMNSETKTDDTPVFSNVTAYTFACPNVSIVTEENTESKMASYKSIYNFWFESDIVPFVPLSSPKEGWGYWKYGRCYVMNIAGFDEFSNGEKTINYNINSEFESAFSQWKSVDDYYNKQFVTTVYDRDTDEITYEYATLYDLLSSAVLLRTSSVWKRGLALRSIDIIFRYGQFYPLLSMAAKNIYTISTSHDFDTYNAVINGSKTVNGIGSALFYECSFTDILNSNYPSKNMDGIIIQSNDAEIEYNTAEVEKLKAFAQSEGNNDILQWDLENPSSWTGVEWNENGNVSKIDFTYKWLKGSLDCSNFADLTELTLFANSLENINLSGASALTELNCSYNNLGENGLNLSDCNALTKLYCDGCSLNTLDVSKLTELSALSCAFNNLIALNIENNTKLNHINCIYNYLDVHDGSALNTQLKKYRSENKAYVNYFEQSLPDNAVFDEDEWYMLSEIARVYKIYDALDWYDENGNISLEKMQNNVIFEYDGSKYRAAVIDLSFCYGGWDMDFSKFTKLKALYCDDSTVCGLDLSGCNELTTLVCTDAKIYNIEFPTSATTADSKLTVLECENNFIRIDKFPDGLIENIKSKPNYSLKYRKQLNIASEYTIHPDDYNAIVDFANQQVDYAALEWISNSPDTWYNINWMYDEKTNKFRMIDCDFSGLDVRGNIDFSKCDMLENLSLRGTDISTAKVPAGVIDENTFKNCSNLSAVIVIDGTEIADNTFLGCPSLQAVYIPSTVEKIGANAFDDSKNIAFAGESGSYAESYAKAQSKPFKPGFFICGNVVEKSDSKDWIPIKNAEIISGETTVATTDKNGFFVIFSLENGDCSLSVKANDSKTATIEATIENSPTVLDLISV